MVEGLIYAALAAGGLVLGSFAGATVWRLRARQLVADRKAGEKVDHKEYNRLHKLSQTPLAKDRSRCLHCDYVLRWYDLIPVVSWLLLRGRCRHCRKPIGWFEPLIELGMAAFMVLSYLLWPVPLDSGLAIAQFVVWLVAGVGLAILFSYDVKWFLLPDKVNLTVISLGLATTVLVAIQSGDPAGTLFSALGAVGVLSGIYLALYLVSRGAWIGFGDVKLGIGLGLLLVNWQSAIVALFAANLIGTLIVIPLLAKGRLQRRSHVPFGPLLIAGAIIAQFAGGWLVELYSLTLI